MGGGGGQGRDKDTLLLLVAMPSPGDGRDGRGPPSFHWNFHYYLRVARPADQETVAVEQLVAHSPQEEGPRHTVGGGHPAKRQVGQEAEAARDEWAEASSCFLGSDRPAGPAGSRLAGPTEWAALGVGPSLVSGASAGDVGREHGPSVRAPGGRGGAQALRWRGAGSLAVAST